MARRTNCSLLDFRVHQEGIIELGHLARLPPSDRLQARRERLMPFHRQAGDVAHDALDLFPRDIAGEWNRVQAGAADR